MDFVENVHAIIGNFLVLACYACTHYILDAGPMLEHVANTSPLFPNKLLPSYLGVVVDVHELETSLVQHNFKLSIRSCNPDNGHRLGCRTRTNKGQSVL